MLWVPFCPPGTSTPDEAGAPICTPEPGCPAMICLAMVSARLIGMAKPTLCWLAGLPLVLAAVSMPMTLPVVLASGPPESPGMMSAFVWSMPVSFSGDAPLPSSLAEIDWFRPVIVPGTVADLAGPIGIAHADHVVAELDGRGVPDRDCGQARRAFKLDHGDVRALVVAEPLGRVLAVR